MTVVTVCDVLWHLVTACVKCAIYKHGILAMCVRELKQESEDIMHVLESYLDLTKIGIPTLFGLLQGTVSAELLPQLCFNCCISPYSTIIKPSQAMMVAGWCLRMMHSCTILNKPNRNWD